MAEAKRVRTGVEAAVKYWALERERVSSFGRLEDVLEHQAPRVGVMVKESCQQTVSESREAQLRLCELTLTKPC